MVNYGPHTDFLEKTFLAGNFVAGAGYGIQLVLYGWCMIYLWSQRKRQGKAMIYLLIYITILLFLESLFVAAGTWTVQGMYISHRNYPGGPWAYFLTTRNRPETVVLFASLLVLTFLSDLLVLWRCWVIWNSSGKLVAYAVIAFPIAVLLASFALGTIWTLRSTEPGPSLHISVPMAFGTAYYVTSLGVNILVTILITIRLVFYRRSIMDTLPPEHAAQYLSVDTILIESAALYSIFALGFIISYSVNNPMNQVFMSLASTCQQIAGYLIILRLAQGRAWDSSTLTKAPMSEAQLTTVQFSTPTTTTQFGCDQDLMDIEAQRDPFSSIHVKRCTVRG